MERVALSGGPSRWPFQNVVPVPLHDRSTASAFASTGAIRLKAKASTANGTLGLAVQRWVTLHDLTLPCKSRSARFQACAPHRHWHHHIVFPFRKRCECGNTVRLPNIRPVKSARRPRIASHRSKKAPKRRVCDLYRFPGAGARGSARIQIDRPIGCRTALILENIQGRGISNKIEATVRADLRGQARAPRFLPA